LIFLFWLRIRDLPAFEPLVQHSYPFISAPGDFQTFLTLQIAKPEKIKQNKEHEIDRLIVFRDFFIVLDHFNVPITLCDHGSDRMFFQYLPEQKFYQKFHQIPRG
jgi:hypothetical protein